MNELALFAGAGGGILGTLLLGWRVVCAVEINPYCREVLLRRQEEGILPPFPIWDDIRTFDGKAWCGKVEVVTAGFPCQPWSVAGQQRGELDERNLWPDTIRIIREIRPRYCLLENVPNLLTHEYFGTILRDLAASGFDVRWKVISAAEVGAPHKRDRLWIVAHDNGSGKISPEYQVCSGRNALELCSQDVADPSEQRLEGDKSEVQPGQRERLSPQRSRDVADTECISDHGRASRISWWDMEPLEALQAAREGRGQETWLSIPESILGRVADGLAYRVERLSALGEGQVPAVVRAAWELLR